MASFEQDYPDTAKVITEFSQSAGSIKLGLKDSHLTVDEIVASIPDENLREGIKTQLTCLKALPAEFEKLKAAGPWVMMSQFAPFLMQALTTGVFK